MAMLISSYEDLIYGEDGHAPIRKVLDDALRRAVEDKTRLRVEIRVKPVGVPTSRQESVFFADPAQTTSDNLMRVLSDRLEDSPGPEFHGQLRINFNPAGQAHEKYGSWTRAIRYGSGNITHPSGLRAVALEGDENDPNGLYITPEMEQEITQQGERPLVDHRTMQQWLETCMGFTFRSMAQQMTMFERSTRMMEAYTMRFNFPHPAGIGITEAPVSAGGSKNTNSGGMGLLPMLLNAAAHMANADSPQDMAARAGSMATGTAPPPGAARQAAVQGAGRLIGNLARPAQPAEPAPGYDPAPSPDPYDPESPHDLGGGGMSYDEDEDDYSGEEGWSEPEEPQDVNAALGALSPEQMKEAVVSWIRSNPEQNKAAVMDMIPELTKEIM
jgi:hypothetical protein